MFSICRNTSVRSAASFPREIPFTFSRYMRKIWFFHLTFGCLMSFFVGLCWGWYIFPWLSSQRISSRQCPEGLFLYFGMVILAFVRFPLGFGLSLVGGKFLMGNVF